MKKIIVVAACFAMAASSAFSQLPTYDQGQKFKDVLNIVNAYYTDTVDNKKLVDDAIAKILEDLDPHSSYVKAQDVKRSEEPLQANFEGVGISFQILKDTITVQEVISGCPSEKVGIRVGDRIVKVDDTTAVFKGLDNNWVIKHLRGPKGSKVSVSIIRKGNTQPLTFVIQRDKIPIYSVEAHYMVLPDVGYVKISRFAATTMQEFHTAVKDLRNKGMKNIIVDLQDNTGGYLYTAIDLCNQFLMKDQMIVYTQGLHSQKSESRANGNGMFKFGKVIVLINEGSASASEILSGCIQDNDRGLLVGRRTWGKGLVQKPFNLPDGSQIKLTTAHYYIPSDRCIKRPYDNGKKDYNDEYMRRYNSGELFGSDTFKQPDSLKYKTIYSGRTVYGGGGVSPDYFVPVDTTGGSRYYNALIRRGFLVQHGAEYLDKNRAKILAQFPTAESFISSYVVPDSFYQNLYAAAESDTSFLNDITVPKEDTVITEFTTIKFGDKDYRTSKAHDLKRSSKALPIAVKANLARNLFDANVFWQVSNVLNNPLQKAIAVIQNDKNFDVLFKNTSIAKGKKKQVQKDKEETERWRFQVE
ncbi:MAG TPA: S41 family peptidase [Chitinophagales bacterium]|nr:S41 family peptidase [Chitinophagales bacterium]